jgi:hypothetical protein
VIRIGRADALTVARLHLLRQADSIVAEEFAAAGYAAQDRPVVTSDGWLTSGAECEPAELPEVTLGGEWDFSELRRQCAEWIADDENVRSLFHFGRPDTLSELIVGFDNFDANTVT